MKRLVTLQELIEELTRQFHEISDASVLEKGVDLLHRCLANTDVSFLNRRIWISNLVMLLMKRYNDKSTSHILALHDAASYYRNELGMITTSERNISAMITNFSIILTKEYEEEDIHPSAEDVLLLLREFVGYFDSKTSIELYQPLYHQLIQLITYMVDEKHSDNVIYVIIRFIGLIPSSDGKHPLAFNALYRILSIRYRDSDSQNFPGVHDIPEDHFDLFYELSETLQLRSKQVEDKEGPNKDLDDAILCLRATILLPAVGSECYARSKRLLGACLLDRNERNDDADDLNEGVKHTMTHE
ncbi:hypothetical protein BDQ17DRAFT_1543921 [Cyathus striatus]|nr:hypothetical protein BDQ17DRAFT_1543921 [Cyathus striatus]